MLRKGLWRTRVSSAQREGEGGEEGNDEDEDEDKVA